MKNGKIVNFILEISQVFLVFLGVYSAIMCAAMSLSLPVNRGATTLVGLGAAFLFYGLFTVLETFHHGKLYGILGITAFYLVVILRFRSILQKGIVTIINTYLKEFMNYTQSEVSLFTNKGFVNETAGVEYCTTLVVILILVYLTAIVSSCFYRKRRSSVFIGATILFFFIPVTVGKIGYFSNVVTYIFSSMAIVGTRFLRYDTTDKKMRQKLSLVLAGVGVIAGLVTYMFIPPERYEGNLNDIVEVKNSALALTTWDREDIMTWFREYFSGDAMEYGRIGKRNSVTRSGKTLMKINGTMDTKNGIYFKGYTGVNYSENRWRQVNDDTGEFDKEKSALEADGLSLDNWQVTLRTQIGDKQKTGNPDLWKSGNLTIKNIAFGYSNYIAPYYPTTAFSMAGGRITNAVPGAQYTVEYFPQLCKELRNGLAANTYRLADNDFWVSMQAKRDRLTAFAKKYYVQIPEEVTASGILDDYKNYLNSQDALLDKYNQGSASLYQMIEETRNYIMKDTKYTLSPGRTPKDKDAVVYFLSENKKGYSNHYASAAAVLLRSIGIPTRYVEGVYVSADKLADVVNEHTVVNVTDKDLHAWIEVYQDNYGFVPVEVTPGMGEEESANSSVTDENTDAAKDQQSGDGSSSGDSSDGAAVTAPTAAPEEDMTFEDIKTDNYNHDAEPTTEPQQAQSAVKDEKKDNDGGVSWWKLILIIVGVLVLLAAAIEGQRRIRIAVFKKNLKSSKHRRQIILFYHQLEKAFIRQGVIYRGQSVAVYSEQLAKTYDMDEAAVRTFVTMVFGANYSRHQFSKEEMVTFRKIYRDMRHKAYANLKGVQKLYYLYVLGV